jgi:hypothetical protein
MTDSSSQTMLHLLARWQAFSELQQRAFDFLAGEALSSGQEFENSTEGATRVLTRFSDFANGGTSAEDLKAETFSVVHRLQAADRSRQGLEQVASVLTTLKTQHEALVTATRATANLPDVETMLNDWIGALTTNVAMADWRHRLDDALHGRPPSAAAQGGDEELF